ncbi:hypothetical protein [Pseudomonas sp. BN515]|uniref:hypothetical protein n=1 Tax=Pseudomonas sp. BN515 TaxID=2567892 RepID=UPI002453A98F|nr:hypothetical protein [Pseudomonas sp. BN515]MDH4872905.1 hypothetical protein [Pseudomonas sp. BN515]
MASYFHINSPSNLIVGVIASSYTPTDTKVDRFILATDKALDKYYKWLKTNSEVLPDLGELMIMSPTVHDAVIDGRSAKVTPQRISYRAPQPERVIDRAASIAKFIADNPGCDEHELHHEFNCGLVAGRQYLAQYA